MMDCWTSCGSHVESNRGGLSPLLFALYVAGLGIKLQETKLGIHLGSVTLDSGLFFADDLVLISRTSCLHTIVSVY